MVFCSSLNFAIYLVVSLNVDIVYVFVYILLAFSRSHILMTIIIIYVKSVIVFGHYKSIYLSRFLIDVDSINGKYMFKCYIHVIYNVYQFKYFCRWCEQRHDRIEYIHFIFWLNWWKMLTMFFVLLLVQIAILCVIRHMVHQIIRFDQFSLWKSINFS